MRSTFTPRPVLIAALCSALLACPLARAESGFVLNIAHMNDTHSKFDPVDGVLRNPALSGGGIENGTVMDMTPLPLPFKVGVPGIGGPMMTKGGVAFLGAAVDDYLRAYDVTDGRQLWEARLPAGGQATPMTYTVGDKQYVLIVAGGHGSVGTKPGDYVIAYTLP